MTGKAHMENRSSAAIVYAADDGYALPVAVSGRSLQDNLAESASISWYVLDMGLSERSRDLITASWPAAGHVEFIKITRSMLRDLPSRIEAEGLVYPVQVFGYLMAPQLLQTRHERVICLDADTLVIGDVGPLLNVPLDGRPFGAVQDWPFPESTVTSTSEYYSPERQLNAGIVVIDTELWCRNHVTAEVFSFARRHDDLKLPDQDSLNAVMRQGWTELGGEWNFQVSRTVVRDYRGPLPRILHFSGPRKPWLGRSALPHFLRLYHAYSERTAFTGSVPDEISYPHYQEDDGSPTS